MCIKTMFQQFATKRNLVVLFLLTVLCNVLMALYFGDLTEQVLDTYLYYSASEAYEAMEKYGDYKRQRYIQGTILLDFIYPVIYCLLLSFSLFRLKVNARRAILPWWILLVDYLENGIIIFLLSRFPVRYEGLAGIAGVVTLIKWLMVIASILSLIILFFVGFYRRKYKHHLRIDGQC